MDSIISTFHIDWKIIVAQALNFGIVFAVLYIFALKPLSKLMAERGEKIAKGMDDAKENALLVEKTRSEYEKVIIAARAEANDLFEDTKNQAEKERAEMMERTKNEISELVNQGKVRLTAERAQMVEDAKMEIVALATQITEKLVGSSVDGSLNKKAIKELEDL